MELVSLHAVAASPRIALVFHNNIHSYLRSQTKIALTSLEQLFKLASVDG